MGCQYLGPEFDPQTWPYGAKPVPYCGCDTLLGKSYCAEHYHVVYKKGSASLKRVAREIDREIKDLELQTLIAEQEADLEEVNV